MVIIKPSEYGTLPLQTSAKIFKYIKSRVINKSVVPYFLLSIALIAPASIVFVVNQKKIVPLLVDTINSFLPTDKKAALKESFVIHLIESGFKVNPLMNYLSGIFLNQEKLYIDIDFNSYQKLLGKRDLALKSGVLISYDDDYIKAKITYKRKSYPVKLRLKGDWNDHLQGSKWSFRIHLLGGNTLFGLRKFSIQSPNTRNFMNEWIYHKLLKDEGLPALRYSFLPVNINGKNLGIYALEEHFDKLTVESNNYKEGPIIRINESNKWIDHLNEISILSDSYLESDISTFTLKKNLSSHVLKLYLVRATALLDGFRRGSYSTSEVFEVKKLAKFFAITDLLGGHHGSIWSNMRFYYNPITDRLIPVGYDAVPSKFPQNKVSIEESNPLPFFKDNDFSRKYIQELESVSRPEYLQSFIERNKLLIESNLRSLYLSYPAYSIGWRSFEQNARYIRSKLNPKYSVLSAYEQDLQHQKYMTVSVANSYQLPLRLHKIVDSYGNTYTPRKPTIVAPRAKRELPTFNQVTFFFSKKKAAKEEKVNNLKTRIIYSLAGLKHLFSQEVNPYPRSNSHSPRSSQGLASMPNFVSIDHKAKTYTIKEGSWVLRQRLTIPEGYGLNIAAGTSLALEPNADIQAYESIKMVGSKEKPIYIDGLGSGANISVIGASKPSIFSYVNFKGLSFPSDPYSGISGGLTIYESEARISNCSFLSSNSEDSVNIVRSKFLIHNSTFLNSHSDALDIDFSSGVISDSIFENSGNDGLDVSGSEVVIRRVRFKSVGDKAISVGERSTIKASSVSINNSEIGVAVKDDSVLTASSFRINNSKLPFAVFQKKPEYGPARLIVRDVNVEKYKRQYLLETGSTIEIDGSSYSVNTDDADSYLYGTIYGKKTVK